jgi:hypothetical protein
VEIDSKEILKWDTGKENLKIGKFWRRHLKEAKVRLRAVAP